MKVLLRLFNSSLGQKYLMAGSGLALFLFVVGHLLGNLQFFLGPETLNRYAAMLHRNPGLLWAVRIGLLVVVALHMATGVRLWWLNRCARPVAYFDAALPGASLASRTMVLSGLIIASFVVYHLLHFAVRVDAINLTGQDFAVFEYRGRDGTVMHDVFRMMVAGFSSPWVSGFYLLSLALLCLHLSHGLSAWVQSFGLKGWQGAPWVDRAAMVVAWAIFAGYAAIPVAVLLGYGKEVLR